MALFIPSAAWCRGRRLATEPGRISVAARPTCRNAARRDSRSDRGQASHGKHRVRHREGDPQAARRCARRVRGGGLGRRLQTGRSVGAGHGRGRGVTRTAVRALIEAADALRATARGLETLELANAEREDLPALLAGIRRAAFLAVAIAAVEVGSENGPRTGERSLEAT